MQIIVNATFLINTLKTEPDMLRQLKLATIRSVAHEVGNELGIDLNDFNIEIIQTKSSSLEIRNDKKQRLSSTDINLLKTCYEHKNRCIMISDDLQLKNAASENNIKCYTTPEFTAYLLKTGKIPRSQCIKFLNILRKSYIRTRDIDKILKRIEGW